MSLLCVFDQLRLLVRADVFFPIIIIIIIITDGTLVNNNNCYCCWLLILGQYSFG